MMRIRLAATVIAATALLGACGDDAKSTPEPSPAPASTSAGHGGYAACLAEHGVATPPAGPEAPPGVDAQTWAKAREACSQLAPGPAN